MLTRSKAKALALQKTTVLVSPSATGKGTHIRWQYPSGSAAPSNFPDPFDSSSISSGSISSSSSFSDLSSPSSVSSISSCSSLHTGTSQLQTTPATPSRRRAQKLQRSPGHLWIENNGDMRIVLVPDSLQPEDVIMQESMADLRIAETTERELALLQKHRDMYRQSYDQEMEVDQSDEEDFFQGQGTCQEDNQWLKQPTSTDPETSVRRGETVPLEDIDPGTKWSPRYRQVLGPQATEMIDPRTFGLESSQNGIYLSEWKRALVGQETEIFIK